MMPERPAKTLATPPPPVVWMMLVDAQEKREVAQRYTSLKSDATYLTNQRH
jgi:hypothetical protein